jgi:hypothetical protein
MKIRCDWILGIAAIYVASFRRILGFTIHASTSGPSPYSFQIVNYYMYDKHVQEGRTLVNFLYSEDPVRFPSKTQARRACAMCSIAVWRAQSSYACTNAQEQQFDDLPLIQFISISCLRNSCGTWLPRSASCFNVTPLRTAKAVTLLW